MREFTVSADKGDFKTLNEAASALKGQKEETLLRIVPGEYRESVTFECSNLTIEGDSQDLVYICDRKYSKMKDGDGGNLGTFRTPVLKLLGENITLKNVTIENIAGIGFKLGPAVALYSDVDRFVCENCKIIAHQDTLFTGPVPDEDRSNRQVYRNCYIEGDVDFIFGGASALFENCTVFSHDMIAEYRLQEMICSTDNDWDAIHSFALRGYVCAPSTSQKTADGYLFLDCHFTSNCPKETVFLGRPWRPYGRAYFINCTIGNHIKDELFSDWDDAKNRETCRFVISDCRRTDGTLINTVSQKGFAEFMRSDDAASYVKQFKKHVS